MNLPMIGASLVAAALVLAAVFIAARRDRNRHLDEPTEMLPVLDDPIARHFNEAERILRGECDPDFAWLADRRRLRPYEVEFQTAEIRKLTRRLARLDQT